VNHASGAACGEAGDNGAHAFEGTPHVAFGFGEDCAHHGKDRTSLAEGGGVGGESPGAPFDQAQTNGEAEQVGGHVVAHRAGGDHENHGGNGSEQAAKEFPSDQSEPASERQRGRNRSNDRNGKFGRKYGGGADEGSHSGGADGGCGEFVRGGFGFFGKRKKPAGDRCANGGSKQRGHVRKPEGKIPLWINETLGDHGGDSHREKNRAAGITVAGDKGRAPARGGEKQRQGQPLRVRSECQNRESTQ